MKKICAIVVLFAIAACSDQRYEYFNTGSEARQSIQAKQGWIPDWLPAAAKDIHVQYDVDTNCRWFGFRLPDEARKAFLATFRPLSRDQARNIRVPEPRRGDWWFHGPVQDQNDLLLRDDVKVPEKAYLLTSKTGDQIFLWIERQP